MLHFVRISRRSHRFHLALLTGISLSALTAAQAQTVVLDTITVSGTGGTAQSDAQSVVARDSTAGTKTNTPILETPQSISVVTERQIEQQQAQSIVEALRYTPGVSLDAFSANTFFDEIKVRGFLAPQYLDGLKLPIDPGTSFAIPKIEPYGLQRIEVLKGPSSGLYGQTNPGGLVNMVSKRPTSTPTAEVEVQYGSFDRYQGAFDFGGPIDKEGQFLWRLTGLVRDSNTQIDHVEDNKIFIAPAFTWAPTAATSLTFLSQYQKIDNAGFQQYVPGVGTLLPNPNGRIPYSRYLGEPSLDGFTLEQTAVGYAFEHKFNEGLQFRQNLRYTTVSNNLTGVREEGLVPGSLTRANRSVNYVEADSSTFQVDNQLQADFNLGPLAHKVLFGLDYMKTDSHSDYRFAGINSINIYTPGYRPGAVPPASALAPFILNDAVQKQTGVYIQDQVKWDRFTLSVTGRHDWATTDNDNRAFFPPPGVTSVDDTATTGRVGLSYLFPIGIAPYVSWATSFVPLSGTGPGGTPFRPTTGEAREIGVKYQPTGMDFIVTAALFETEQQNVLQPAANPLFNVQRGGSLVKGFEIEARGNLSKELEVIAGFSALNPKSTTNDGAVIGDYLPNVPTTQASLWVNHTWFSGALAGLGIGAGVRYVGDSYTFDFFTGRYTVDSYTLYDAALSYDFQYVRPDWKGLTAQLNVRNLTDEYYVSSCVSGVTYCGLGSGRSVLLTMKYKWM